MRNKSISLSLIFFLLTAVLLNASTVIHSPKNLSSLEDRWAWAVDKAKNLKGEYWVGYSIERLMSKNSFIGSCGDSDYGKPTLRTILQGKISDQGQNDENQKTTIKEAAERALRSWEGSEDSDEKVMKEVGILFFFKDESLTFENIAEMKISNLSQYVDLKDKPVIWLGECEQEESVDFLTKRYQRIHSDKIKKELIVAVALHKGIPSTITFLSGIVNNEDNNSLRKDAVFWLSQQGTDDVLPILVRTTKRDPASGVREQAVFAISQVNSDEGTETLIDLARHAYDNNVQKKAIFWLGQKAGKRAAETLQDMVYDNETIEIQEQAVFALSQLKRREGVPSLIEIAKNHPSIEVRKKAIFWLSQSDDPRALDAIVQLARE